MREIGQGSVPTDEMEGVTFPSLRLAETKERVEVTLDERMLSVQGRRQASLDIRLNAIHTVKHHSSQLIPPWMVMAGLCFLWIGYRVMVPPLYRLGFMAIGSAMVMARFVTKQPTLTVQTQSGDTHVLFGNEPTLNRLSFMFHQLANGKSMAEVKAMIEAIEADMGQVRPHSDIPPAPSLPVALHTPRAVDAFLASSGVEVEPDPNVQEENEPEWTPMNGPEPVAPSPHTGFFPTFPSTYTAVLAGPTPSDHRPRPINNHVLIPVEAPPMHQPASGQHATGLGFIPSWHGPDSGEVLPQDPSDIDANEEPILEAEQVVEALDRPVDEHGMEVETAPRTPSEERLFTPRRPRELADTVFMPRRPRVLHPRQQGSGRFRNVRHRSRAILGRIRPARPPSPYGTSSTSSALRENAEASRPPEPANVLEALSTEHGGVLNPEEAARLAHRAEAMRAAAMEIEQTGAGGLNTMSFEDLKPSKPSDDLDGLPRLDDD